MNAIKSKALFVGLSLFAFTAIHAQDTDTSKTPQPDTTKPKTDTTVMVNVTKVNRENTAMLTKSFVMINDNRLAAKMEAIDSKEVI